MDFVNTVTITSEEYKNLIEENTTLRIELMRLKLETSEMVTEYRNIKDYFVYNSYHKQCFEDWLSEKLQKGEDNAE